MGWRPHLKTRLTERVIWGLKRTTQSMDGCGVSVVIPVYKGSELLDDLLRSLMEQSVRAEVIVVADEPTAETLSTVRKYSVKLIVNENRRGKVYALNAGAREAKGDILVFLDADTKVERDFLKNIIEEMRETSILDVKKRILCDGLLSRLVNIDYFNMYISSLFSTKFNTCMGLNGACIAVRREDFFKLGGFRRTITEDVDLGIRAAMSGVSVKTARKAYVLTQPPQSWREWYRQRGRWAVGGALCVLEYFKFIIRKPKVWSFIIMMHYPAMIHFFASMMIPDNLVYGFLSLIILMLFLLKLPVLLVLPALFFLSFSLVILKGMLAALITFSVWMCATALGFRITKWGSDVKPYDFLAYYFIYSPLWLFVSAKSLAKVGMATLKGKEIEVKNWKV